MRHCSCALCDATHAYVWSDIRRCLASVAMGQCFAKDGRVEKTATVPLPLKQVVPHLQTVDAFSKVVRYPGKKAVLLPVLPSSKALLKVVNDKDSEGCHDDSVVYTTSWEASGSATTSFNVKFQGRTGDFDDPDYTDMVSMTLSESKGETLLAVSVDWTQRKGCVPLGPRMEDMADVLIAHRRFAAFGTIWSHTKCLPACVRSRGTRSYS